MPFITGVLTTVIQLLTGVGGLFLDIFFQKSMLDRKTTIATKAVTQTFSHVVRAVYFGSFVGIADAVPLWTYVPAIVLSIAGTTLAAQVLERMTDVGFRHVDAARDLRRSARSIWRAASGCSAPGSIQFARDRGSDRPLNTGAVQ